VAQGPNLEDYGRWNRITNSAISSDGKWVTFTYSPNEGDPVFHVRRSMVTRSTQLRSAARRRRPWGGGGRGGVAAATRRNSPRTRWVTYFVNPPDRTAGRGRAAIRLPEEVVPPAGRRLHRARTPELLNLATGEKVTVPNVGSWKFSGDSKWLAMRLNRAQADAKFQGADLVLRELASGIVRNIGNVNQYEFDDAGRLLAYTVDAADRLGNGIYLLDMASGDTKVLNSGTFDFDQPVWSREGTSLAVLRGDKARDQKQKANVLLAWSGLGTPGMKPLVFDPSKDATFPKGLVLSEFTAPRWSRDGSRVFIGIKEQEKEAAAEDSTKANVDVWHWKDTTPQSVQIVQLQQLRRATYPAVVFVGTGKFLRLGDDEMRTVTPAANSNVAVGRIDAAYRGEVAGGARDLYKVDVNTGARSLIEKGSHGRTARRPTRSGSCI
jgi:hypothetical protein